MKKSLIALVVLAVGACSVTEPQTPFKTDGNATENFERMEKDFIPGADRTIWETKEDTTGAPAGTESAERLYTYSDNKFLANAYVSVRAPEAGDESATSVSSQYSVAPMVGAPVALDGYTVEARDDTGNMVPVTLDKGYSIYTTDQSRAIGGSASNPRANGSLNYSLIWIDGNTVSTLNGDVDTEAKTIELYGSTPTVYTKI